MTTEPRSLSRREFTALSIAAGVAAATRVSAAAAKTIGQPINLRMPSGGVNDAFLVRPEGEGQWPAVILFTDAFGRRPTMHDMAQRLATEGYVVLVPNPYYRSTRAPGIDASKFDFSSTSDRAKLQSLRAPLTNAAVAEDARAYLAFLDEQPFVNKKARAGAFGYCMGGLMTLQAAAGVPERIGAGASFHGGGLVTDKPDSPHLLVPRMQGEYLIAIAANDDQAQPEAKTKLAEAFRAANIPAKVEVYEGTLHGWCVKDMPLQNGKPIYNEEKAERAWSELLGLFKRRLV
jgi:carboxymethylenebutenolidase